MNGWEFCTGFVLGIVVASFTWDLAIRALQARLAASLELTKDERTVLILNIAGPVANKTGVLDNGELRSVLTKLVGAPDG